jgi:hypothetical protein
MMCWFSFCITRPQGAAKSSWRRAVSGETWTLYSHGIIGGVAMGASGVAATIKVSLLRPWHTRSNFWAPAEGNVFYWNIPFSAGCYDGRRLSCELSHDCENWCSVMAWLMYVGSLWVKLLSQKNKSKGVVNWDVKCRRCGVKNALSPMQTAMSLSWIGRNIYRPDCHWDLSST